MGRSSWFFMTLLVAATACDKPSTAVDPSTSPVDEMLLSRGHESTPIVLTGTVTYWTYAPRIRTLLQDAPFVVPTPGTTTTLEFLGGDSVRLQLHEDHVAAGEGDRYTTLEGTLKRNGKVTLDYVSMVPAQPFGTVPEFLTWLVQFHSGCTITSGDFPRYYGRFDGKELVAATTFNSVCPGPSGTPDAPLFATPVVGRDGVTLTPVKWAWKIHLRVPRHHDDHRDGHRR
jgi:hypothetical protein